MKVFLDTNVVIDFCAHRAPFFQPAACIVDMGYRGEIDIAISALTFINVAYILRKAFPKEDVYAKLGSLAELCDVSPIDRSTVKEAIRRRSSDFEDCVQCFSAMASRADIIVTRDETGFKDLPVPFITPSDFISRCNA